MGFSLNGYLAQNGVIVAEVRDKNFLPKSNTRWVSLEARKEGRARQFLPS